ncbi:MULTISPECIES: hypothetical protein [Streptomyces]|uniref:hypothetical protein n=1 Tax=Streptomyces TaxID=1883 RepID=UPI00345C1820
MTNTDELKSELSKGVSTYTLEAASCGGVSRWKKLLEQAGVDSLTLTPSTNKPSLAYSNQPLSITGILRESRFFGANRPARLIFLTLPDQQKVSGIILFIELPDSTLQIPAPPLSSPLNIPLETAKILGFGKFFARFFLPPNPESTIVISALAATSDDLTSAETFKRTILISPWVPGKQYFNGRFSGWTLGNALTEIGKVPFLAGVTADTSAIPREFLTLINQISLDQADGIISQNSKIMESVNLSFRVVSTPWEVIGRITENGAPLLVINNSHIKLSAVRSDTSLRTFIHSVDVSGKILGVPITGRIGLPGQDFGVSIDLSPASSESKSLMESTKSYLESAPVSQKAVTPDAAWLTGNLKKGVFSFGVRLGQNAKWDLGDSVHINSLVLTLGMQSAKLQSVNITGEVDVAGHVLQASASYSQGKWNISGSFAIPLPTHSPDPETPTRTLTLRGDIIKTGSGSVFSGALNTANDVKNVPTADVLNALGIEAPNIITDLIPDCPEVDLSYNTSTKALYFTLHAKRIGLALISL